MIAFLTNPLEIVVLLIILGSLVVPIAIVVGLVIYFNRKPPAGPPSFSGMGGGFCSGCGRASSPGDAFCAACGRPLPPR